MKLQGKVAIITGSSRGIGKSIAYELASEGAIIIVNYVKDDIGINKSDAEQTVKSIKKIGSEALMIQADVTNPIQVNLMAEEVFSKFKKIDILVNNAGINRDATLKNLEKKDWDSVISVNLTGTFNCSKSVLNFMINAGRGRIINISSVMGLTGGFGISNYAASKAGIIGFTRSISREVASKGITVNSIAPGFIETEMLNSIPEKIRESIIKQVPAGRWGKAEEVGKLVVFLASDDASYITGQVININGGYYM